MSWFYINFQHHESSQVNEYGNIAQQKRNLTGTFRAMVSNRLIWTTWLNLCVTMHVNVD